MTTPLLVLAGLLALSDWFAVAWGDRTLDRLARPALILALLAAVTTGDLGASKPWVLAALVFSLIANVALLGSRESGVDLFFGLAAACDALASGAYVVAFARHGLHPWHAVAGVLILCGATALLWPRIIHPIVEKFRPPGRTAILGFVLLLFTTVTSGFGTGSVGIAVGVLLLGFAYTTLGWSRFVQRLLRGPALVVVTYQAAQLLIVGGLLA